MVRDPNVVIDKDLVSVKPILNDQDRRFYRRMVGECGLALAGDMPIYNEFYTMLMRGTSRGDLFNRHGSLREVDETGMIRLAAGLHPKYGQPSAETRASFHEAFGLLPDMQVALEEAYTRVTPPSGEPKEVEVFGTQLACRFDGSH
jgi:hypothetical protein